VIADEEIDALREIADRIRNHSEFSSYGYFEGGDPRNFTPDLECCSVDELERHKADCAQWDAGHQVDRGPNHIPLDATPPSEPVAMCKTSDGKGWITVAHYGMGVNVHQDPELLKLAQDLDDVIDRIRQVTP
jgi:hypothetical protein